MNNKEKQIEEMAKDFENIDVYDFVECVNCLMFGHNDCDTECFCKQCAKYFYNTGYRKIPENAVVLTKEEYRQLVNIKKFFETADSPIRAENLFVHLKEFKEEARKETAKKILQAVDRESNEQTISITNHLRKKYGVGIKNERI